MEPRATRARACGRRRYEVQTSYGVDTKGSEYSKGYGFIDTGTAVGIKGHMEPMEDAITALCIMVPTRNAVVSTVEASVTVTVVGARLRPAIRLNVRVATARDPWGGTGWLLLVIAMILVA